MKSAGRTFRKKRRILLRLELQIFAAAIVYPKYMLRWFQILTAIYFQVWLASLLFPLQSLNNAKHVWFFCWVDFLFISPPHTKLLCSDVVSYRDQKTQRVWLQKLSYKLAHSSQEKTTVKHFFSELMILYSHIYIFITIYISCTSSMNKT